jgi:hypothetical protein
MEAKLLDGYVDLEIEDTRALGHGGVLRAWVISCSIAGVVVCLCVCGRVLHASGSSSGVPISLQLVANKSEPGTAVKDVLSALGGITGVLAFCGTVVMFIYRGQSRARLQDLQGHLAQLKEKPIDATVREHAVCCYKKLGHGCLADLVMGWQESSLVKTKEEIEVLLRWDPQETIIKDARHKLEAGAEYQEIAKSQDVKHKKLTAGLELKADGTNKTNITSCCMDSAAVMDYMKLVIDQAIIQGALSEDARSCAENKAKMILMCDTRLEEIQDFHIEWAWGGKKFMTYMLLGSYKIPNTEKIYIVVGYSFKSYELAEKWRWNAKCHLNNEDASIGWCKYDLYNSFCKFKMNVRLPTLSLGL